MAGIRQQVIDLLTSRSRDISREGPGAAIDTCFRLAFSTFMDFGTFSRHMSPARQITWRRLISEVAHACTTYLFAPAPDL
jgi:hypothetical protein